VVDQYESLYQLVIAEGLAASTKSVQLSASSPAMVPASEFERVDEQFSKITRQASSRG